MSDGLRACRRPRGTVVSVALVVTLSSCRIYRDEDRAGVLLGAAGSSERAAQALPETVEQKPPAPPAPGEQSPPAEALSLWVLNRPETELVARGPEPPPTPAIEAVPNPPSSALVVLGLGPGHACAELYARRALHYAASAPDPLRGVSVLLDDLRRWRWPAAAALDATIKSSEGRFGAVQSAPASAFSVTLMETAWRRGAVLDGRSSRWLQGGAAGAPLDGPLSPEALGSGCDSPPGAGLRGPAGVLLRTAHDKYFGGLIQLESPADAGLISAVTQDGVSLAMGPLGGVMLLTDCSTLSSGARAEDVYAHLPGERPLPSAAGASCQINHALITPRGARVTGTGALAWASATDREWVTAGPSPRDAGVPPAESEGAP